MSDEKQLTLEDISALTGLARATLINYTSGRSEPTLPCEYSQGRGRQALVRESDFQRWWAEYKSKKPWGARLHEKYRFKAG